MSVRRDNKIFGLDLLRAVAISLVFLWHFRRYGTPERLSPISAFGWTGVDLFFVLSGFLIGGQLFEKLTRDHTISLSQFYIKRFFRILPAYFVVLSIYFLVPAFSERDNMSAGWKFLTFAMNFGLDYRQAGSFSHAWSLCIEEQFYLLLPLIMLLALRLQLKRAFILCFLTSIFIFGFAIRAYSWQTYVSPLYGDGSQEASVGNIYSTWIYYPTYCRLDGLLVGILIALGFTFKPEMREKLWARSWIFLLLGLAILIATYFLYEEPFAFHTAILSYPFVSIGYGFILIACTNPSGKIQKLKLRVISYLATLSYSFYLVHKPINHITVSLLSAYDVNRTILFIICFICSLLAAMLLHYAVEKPFLKLREKFL